MASAAAWGGGLAGGWEQALRQLLAAARTAGPVRMGGLGAHGGHGRRPQGGPPWGWGGGAGWGPGGEAPPWAAWGPWGPPGGPRRRGGRGRGRGDVRLAVLGLLAEQPRHGYQLIQEILERSRGEWRPSPGSVYPTLSQLEDEGLVRAAEDEGRRVFTLTADGRSAAAERADEFAALWERPAPTLHGEAVKELGALVVGVGAAAVQVATAGSVDQQRRAAELLERARTDLYRLMAGDLDDDPDDSTDPDDGAEPDDEESR